MRALNRSAMKKEYIAIYVGFGLTLFSFGVVFGLDFLGYKTESLIALGGTIMIFGLLLMIGIYSNIKNYGYFYSGVRRHDSHKSIKQLDKIYKRTSKGSLGYSIMMWTLSITAIAMFGCGLMLVFHYIEEPNRVPGSD